MRADHPAVLDCLGAFRPLDELDDVIYPESKGHVVRRLPEEAR